jgi:Xaa-Pro aminopeptidase
MKSTDIIKASANSLNIYSFTAEALERLIEAVKAEQPCPTCEALARTVMLDQTSHDTQRTWVGLTDKDYQELHLQMGPTYFYQDYGKAIEAKLKEKNT